MHISKHNLFTNISQQKQPNIKQCSHSKRRLAYETNKDNCCHSNTRLGLCACECVDLRCISLSHGHHIDRVEFTLKQLRKRFYSVSKYKIKEEWQDMGIINHNQFVTRNQHITRKFGLNIRNKVKQ
jgi:hypothetical protein